LSASGSSSDAFQKFGGCDAQSLGNQDDVFDARIADAPLDVAEIRAVEVSFFCERFLGKPFGSPMFRYALAERTEDWVTLSHGPYFTTLSEMSLSVMSDNVFSWPAALQRIHFTGRFRQ
jgi:hypothetical protein